MILTQPARPGRLVAALVMATATLSSPAQGGAAAKWDGLVQRPPCDWLDAAVVEPVVGPGLKAQARTTKAETACVWRTANGNPVLSASVVAWTSPAQLVQERDGLLQQIAQYGGDRFERLPAPGGAATIVIRNDRGRVTIFPTGSASAQAITVNPHFVLKESPEQKAVRRERALGFTRALVGKYGL